MRRKDLSKETQEEHEFERSFYEIVAGCKNLEVIPLNDAEGNIISLKQLDSIESRCFKNNLKRLFRVTDGKYQIIFDVETHLVGIKPEKEEDAFYC